MKKMCTSTPRINIGRPRPRHHYIDVKEKYLSNISIRVKQNNKINENYLMVTLIKPISVPFYYFTQ